MQAAPVAAFAKDADGRYQFANAFLLATMGKYMGTDWRGKTDADFWPPDAAALMRKSDEAVMGGAGPQVFSRVIPGEKGPHTVLLIEFPLLDGEKRVGVGGLAVDVTEYSETQAERARLTAITDHTDAAIITVDLDGRITDVNPVFERSTGYSREEVLGRNPRILSSGLQKASFYQDMWASLLAGVPWSGEFVNKRRNGTLLIERAVIVPVRDADRKVVGYVAVETDVTNEHDLATSSAMAVSVHALVLQVVREIRPGATPESTASDICMRVATLPGIAAAQLIAFESSGGAVPIGQVLAGRPNPPLIRLPLQLSRRLHGLAALGPWTEPWANRQGQAYDQLVKNAGPSALIYAPVRHGGRLVGLLVVQSVDVANKNAIDDLAPTIAEFADVAGALLGPALSGRIDAQVGREHVSGIIADGAFWPVFQPIVDIVQDKVVGYEALTRFADGSDPEAVFAEAAASGVGVQLEIATLRAALEAAEALPDHAWLNVNSSPKLILAHGHLRSLLSGCRRPVVVEVTEHEAIVDYPAFRTAVAALGPKTRLAVDDAGAGFASLRHILELRPAFVKLDRWLVAGLESDEARQAMIVGLGYFARKVGCQLIAEGIETDIEIALLRSLDIHLGQGYALGRPEAVDASPALIAVGAGG